MDGERLCFSPVDEDSCCGILSWRSLRIVLKLVEQLKLDMFPESYSTKAVGPGFDGSESATRWKRFK